MRTIFLTLTAGLFAANAAAETLTILHTNDFHSRIEPISKYNSGCGEEDNAAGECFGGSARMITAVNTARAEAPNSILVDGGDQFQGSLFYTYYKGQAAAKMMNAIGYDAMTVGNHEFDDGPEVLRGFIDTIEFPILLANADVTQEPSLNGVLLPSTILERGGEKVGLIGITPRDTSILAKPGPNIRFIDPVPAVVAEVAKLQAWGVTRIIALSHSGYGVDQRIASKVDGIDVIVGGHSNTFLSNTSDRADGPYPTWVTTPDGGRTAIVQAYAYGKYLGRLDVTFDADGVVTEATGEPILIDGQVAEDAAVKAQVTALAQPLEEVRTKVVAQSAGAIDGDRKSCRAQECQMGNLVADALVDRTKGQGVTMAIVNGGGLRASIDAGPITMGEVLSVLPFQNVLSTFGLKGSDIVAALEHGVSEIEGGAGQFPQVSGLRFMVDLSVAPGEGRVSMVEVAEGDGWAEIDADKVYLVATSDFLRNGGDGYAMFADKAVDAYDGGPSVEDLVADYLASGGTYQPYTDGRITVK